MVSYRYPPQPGGVSHAVCGLAEALARRGHEVIVYTTKLSHGQSVEIRAGVTIKRMLNISNFQVLYGILPNPTTAIRELTADHPAILNLNGLGHLESVLFARISRDTPVVMSGHGSAIMYSRPDRPWYHLLAWNAYMATLGKPLLRRIDMIVAQAPYEVANWLELGVREENIEVIPWGIADECYREHDASKFRVRHNIAGPMLLFAGTLVPQKGPQWILYALPELVREFPDIKAVFCGPGESYKRNLISLSQKLGVSSNSLFLGYIPREELLRAYAACDLFVLPSDFEAFGLAVAEGMAFGKPVVACRVGALPSLVSENESGMLVGQRDYAELTKAIVSLLRDREKRRYMGDKGRAAARKFTWESTATKYESLYRRVIYSKASS
jgi:glycosyltransferase involved in cell wall biosynthesis